MGLNFLICPFLLFDTVIKTLQIYIRFTFKSLDGYALNIYHVRSFHVHFFHYIPSF